MIFRNKLFDFISFLAILTFAMAPIRLVAENAPITVLTGPLPPYSYKKGGDYKGLLTDVFLELSTKRNLKYKLTSKPWPRAISESKKRRTIIYPFAKTKYREADYFWLGPITEAYHVMVVAKTDKNTYNELADFNDQTIGVLRKAPPHKILARENFKNLSPLSLSSSIAKMLKARRIQAWYDAKSIVEYHMVKNEINPKDFRVAYVDQKMSFYIAFSRDLEKEFVKWREEFKKMVSEGRLKLLSKKYSYHALDQ